MYAIKSLLLIRLFRPLVSSNNIVMEFQFIIFIVVLTVTWDNPSPTKHVDGDLRHSPTYFFITVISFNIFLVLPALT